nr:MAG TPA: hypothetical protein [Caudoviricetes sp.]
MISLLFYFNCYYYFDSVKVVILFELTKYKRLKIKWLHNI